MSLVTQSASPRDSPASASRILESQAVQVVIFFFVFVNLTQVEVTWEEASHLRKRLHPIVLDS